MREAAFPEREKREAAFSSGKREGSVKQRGTNRRFFGRGNARCRAREAEIQRIFFSFPRVSSDEETLLPASSHHRFLASTIGVTL
jgi:hypothetical protein